jgi:hypothetical protein|tara:strand:+ start:226 stop:441 length:216 start_codon:yes stop_codon:yes gene_type:complete
MNLFQQCLDDVIQRRMDPINPGILTNQQRPANFQQKIPDAAYKMRQRHSVFQKVDINAIDITKIPVYQKSQ